MTKIKNYSQQFLNKIVTVKMDRPLNSKHPKHNFKYELNYGFIPDTTAPDGEELDAYVIGVNEPIDNFKGKCIAIIHRLNDDDDKLVVVPEEFENISDEEIIKKTLFQEQWFESEIVRKNFMKTKIIFLRHAQTEKNSEAHATEWGLSEAGKKQAQEIAENKDFAHIDKIYLSEEPKTFLTIEPLLKKNNLIPEKLANFNEVKRGKKYLSDEEFIKEKTLQLTDLNYRAFNGETGTEALERFKKRIEKITAKNSGKTILVVTHGTILNLYFTDLLQTKKIIDRWKDTNFCAYGIVENGEVVKDII